MAPTVPRATATRETLELLRALHQKHGPPIFFQSGGCCERSSPMCYVAGEFPISNTNVYLTNARCWKNRARPDNHGNRG